MRSGGGEGVIDKSRKKGRTLSQSRRRRPRARDCLPATTKEGVCCRNVLIVSERVREFRERASESVVSQTDSQ